MLIPPFQSKCDAGPSIVPRRSYDLLPADAWHLNVKSAIIDGAVIVPATDGLSDFSVLQNGLRGKSKRLALYAFDLLYFHDVRRTSHSLQGIG